MSNPWADAISALEAEQAQIESNIADAEAPVAAAVAAVATARTALDSAQHDLDALQGPIITAYNARTNNRIAIQKLQEILSFKIRTGVIVE